MSVVRWEVDPQELVPLRFDDPEWVDALKLTETSNDDSLYAKLKGALGCEPSEADASGFVADGVYMLARACITGPEEDRISNLTQQDDSRKGIKVDVERANRTMFSTWVMGVRDEAGGIPESLLKLLNHPRRQQREDGYSKLPAPHRTLLLARLRVHELKATAPAIPDERQVTGKAGSGSGPQTSASSSTPLATAHEDDG